MAEDRREAIMVRLTELAATVAGVVKVTRNKLHISEEQRPAVALFDADEEADEGDMGRGRPPHAPNLVTMTPEITLLLGAAPENVGSDLNAFRVAFLKTVLLDATLITICGDNGEIRYRGCATGLSQGRNMEAEMGLDISFRYPLFPTKL